MKSSTYYSAAKKADAYGHKNLADRFRKAGDAAVKNEQIIPIIHVVAKPRIGPVPVTSKITPVISDVKLESKIAEKAFP